MHFHAYVLVPFDVNIDEKVSELMSPYDANLESIPYPRECECVYDSALKKVETGQYAMSGRLNDPVLEFAKDNFEKIGPEVFHKWELLRLGIPDPACEDCRGSGICTTTHNYFTEWDHWHMGTNVSAGELDGSIDFACGFPSGQWVVPVGELDLDKVPTPRAVITPDGTWYTYRKYIWFCNAAIVDENWKETVQKLLEKHRKNKLVIVNFHI